MRLEPQFAEHGECVGCEDLLGASVIEQSESHRHEAPHEMGIRIASEMQGIGEAVRRGAVLDDPNLAYAAPDFVDLRPFRVAQRLQRAAELEDITIAVLPIIEDGEIIADGVERAQVRARNLERAPAKGRNVAAEPPPSQMPRRKSKVGKSDASAPLMWGRPPRPQAVEGSERFDRGLLFLPFGFLRGS